MEDEKLVLLRMHRCSDGLSEEALREIAEAAELIHYEAGEDVYNQGELTSIYLVVQGRLRVTALDQNGKEIWKKFLMRGEHFGGLGTVLEEPLPMHVMAQDPSTLLRIDYERFRALTGRHERFRSNCVRMIALGARDVLYHTKKRVRPFTVAIVHESERSRQLTARLVKRLAVLGEALGVLSDRPPSFSIEGVEHHSLLEGGRLLGKEDLQRRLHHWSNTDRVLIDLDAGIDPVYLTEVVRSCDQTIWCVEPCCWESAAARLQTIEAHPAWRDKVCIAWILERDDGVVPFAPELLALAREDFKLCFEETAGTSRSRVLANGFERVVHLLRGVRIGVALGGGAARGMAHFGVLKALEQSGIVVDMIAGTSSGAMTGTFVAAGLDPDYYAREFGRALTPSWFFRCLPRGRHWYLLYNYRMGRFEHMLRPHLRNWRIEQLPIPLRSITVDLVKGDVVVRHSGDAVHSILESINLPAISAPICRDGKALVDGGLVNNVPADVLVDNGCNFVIAVSVTARIEPKFGTIRPDTHVNGMKPPSTLQTILRSHLVQSMNMNSLGVQPADIVIEPDVTAVDLTEFTRAEELAGLGEKATLEAIPRIKKLLAELDPELFADSERVGQMDIQC